MYCNVIILRFYCAGNVQSVERLQVLEKENAELKAQLERLEERASSQLSPPVRDCEIHNLASN